LCTLVLKSNDVQDRERSEKRKDGCF
jgi:hypothetical protein